MKTSVSAVVLTHNNQDTITTCLKTLTWCDEILVIDDFSTDHTPKLAKQFKVKIFNRHLNNNWSAQRNFALTQTKHDWVLFVDSDETVPPTLRREISYQLASPSTHGYYLSRRDQFFGRSLHYGETANVKLLRLANKNFGRWHRPVHEVWQIRGSVGQLQSPLLHHRQMTLNQFLDRINNYTSLENQEFRIIDLLKPKLKFLYNYLYLFGFRDGMPGFIMAYFMSLHSLIVRVKSWENQHRQPNLP